MMTEKIYIGIDGKRVEAKSEVLEQILKDQAEAAAEAKRIEAETTAKAEARKSALIKFSKLGLTDDEIASLIP